MKGKYIDLCEIGIMPKMYRVRQKMNTEKLENIEKSIYSELDSLDILEKIKGKDIAITAGSRGIANIAEIIKATVLYVKERGGNPFVIPAMGSHGGATAEGQLAVLKHYGITEETMGCQIKSSMETVLLGEAENGVKVYFDKNAFEADGVIVCNRVKPHTDFVAENESGIVKMVSIGLGKEKGCSAVHLGGLGESVKLCCKKALESANIICGLGIVENSKDETYKIKGVLPENFIDEDARLLSLTKSLLPKLPVFDIDLLVVKEIGKQYSGTGMDTKVIGRIKVPGVKEPEFPKIKTIAVLGLSEASYGNALGIGLADITTKEVVETMDRDATYSNLIPTTYLERGKIPVYFDTEKEAIEKGIYVSGLEKCERIIFIHDTLHLEEMVVSEKILAESREKLEVIEENIPIFFNDEGKLVTVV